MATTQQIRDQLTTIAREVRERAAAHNPEVAQGLVDPAWAVQLEAMAKAMEGLEFIILPAVRSGYEDEVPNPYWWAWQALPQMIFYGKGQSQEEALQALAKNRADQLSGIHASP